MDANRKVMRSLCSISARPTLLAILVFGCVFLVFLYLRPGPFHLTESTKSDIQPTSMDKFGVPQWLYAKGKVVRNPFSFCQELYPTEENPYDKDFVEEVKLHDKEFKKFHWGGDGYVMMCCQQQVQIMIDLARIPWVETICEVGFNAGHSALTWLAAKPGTKVYAFDIGHHNYVRPLADYLTKRFPGRFSLTVGNSVEALPKFIKENPSVRCDLVSIDGAHNYPIAVQDFDNFRKITNRRNILHFDDYPRGDMPITAQGLGKVWEEKVANEQLVPLLRCAFHKDAQRKLTFEKGFAVGRIVV